VTYDPEALRQEVIELQFRISELSAVVEKIREERDNALDAATSLHRELEAAKTESRAKDSVISRLRQHIAQGIEL
jgi:predicted  nucleic acid-binding Zn-ribbon protein